MIESAPKVNKATGWLVVFVAEAVATGEVCMNARFGGAPAPTDTVARLEINGLRQPPQYAQAATTTRIHDEQQKCVC